MRSCWQPRARFSRRPPSYHINVTHTNKTTNLSEPTDIFFWGGLPFFCWRTGVYSPGPWCYLGHDVHRPILVQLARRPEGELVVVNLVD